MHCALSLLIVAVMATFALAAPTPTKTHTKGSFAVPAKGRTRLAPADAMKQAARKYGFNVTIDERNSHARRHDFHGWDVYGPSSAAAWSFPSSLPSGLTLPSGFPWGLFSSSAAYGYPSSSAAPWPSQSSSAAPGLSSAASVPYGSASAAPQPSSSIVSEAPSSAAQPSQTSSAGAPAPSSSSPSTGGNEEGEVSTVPDSQNEMYYLSLVTIGNQQLHLNFDTGSADLWVFSTTGNANGHTAFDPSKSSSWSNYNGASWNIQYGDGSTAGGSVGFDKVNIGGVVAQKQCVELADNVDPSFLQEPDMDGLLGLGFGNGNQVKPQPQKTFFESVMADLDQPVFTADLEEDASGTYEFGQIDSSKYTGDIHYAPVDSSMGYWMFDSNSYSVGGTQQQCSTCSPGIADTGTSLILVDQDVADAYYKQVNGASFSSADGGYVYPCSNSLPDFGVAIGDYVATVKGADMTYAQEGSNCFGGVQGTGSSSGVTSVQIYGDVLLKQFFAVFDGGNKRFGIAEKP